MRLITDSDGISIRCYTEERRVNHQRRARWDRKLRDRRQARLGGHSRWHFGLANARRYAVWMGDSSVLKWVWQGSTLGYPRSTGSNALPLLSD